MEALRVADDRTLEPLVRRSGVANSDFYPTLDLNSERTRFMKSEAAGFAGLPTSRVNFAAMMDGRRLGGGDSYAVVEGVPRLRAMSIAASMRNGDARAGTEAVAARARRQTLEATMASTRPPTDWHAWIQLAARVEEEVHGGMAGIADSAFYVDLRAYLSRMNAPAEPRAAIDFLHGMAVWDAAEASRAADVLIPAAARGDLWLDPDQLRDGTVIAKVKSGDRAGAAAAFRVLIGRSSRDVTDLRTRLLYAYIADTVQGRHSSR
jgi:hypothetical protein